MTPTLSVQGGVLSVDGVALRLVYRVDDAKLAGGRIVVLYDPEAGPHPDHFRNLVALTLDGEVVWEAELPVGHETGRLLRSVFFK